MNLLAQYQQAVNQGDVWDDSAQREILSKLQRISDALSIPQRRWFRRDEKIQGLYLYGAVGVGKTYLMDLFYESLPKSGKARVHFHHFMQQVDSQLRQLQGLANPLRLIAKKLAQNVRVLCFDEFLVHDVAHAMIMAELLTALFAQGIVLVATSNIRPDDLYLNGVNRDRFQPAIRLIKQHCQVTVIEKTQDYRLGKVAHFDAFLLISEAITDDRLKKQFLVLASKPEGPGKIQILHRDIEYVFKGGRAIWFEFDKLCNKPRSQLDYLELAAYFDTFFISDMPVLSEKHTLEAILFIQLIDVLYDRGIRLVLSAAVPVALLYPAGEMIVPFQRTLSRLSEMQSESYLIKASHRSSNFLLGKN